jgi:hypothetical protein
VLSLPVAVKLWYCPDPVDMRLGFDGLCQRALKTGQQWALENRPF